MAGGHHSLQLDIERLFAQRIKVFDKLPVSASLDQLVGTVIKVTLLYSAVYSLANILIRLHSRRRWRAFVA